MKFLLPFSFLASLHQKSSSNSSTAGKLDEDRDNVQF